MGSAEGISRWRKWQQKYRVDWDATDGRNGGAQRTLWEVLMEMERFKHRAGEEDQGAVALVLGFRAVCLWSGRGRRTSASRGRYCGCCVGISSTRGECSSQDVCRTPRDHHGHLARVKVELRTSACIVLQDALSEVKKFYPSLKLKSL